jgi:uncharacterized protein YndB with AHSA1/START domain
VDEPRAKLQTVKDRPMLRLERRLKHPPSKVWAAITDAAELAHWFPAAVDAELKVGATIRFTFDGEQKSTEGEILALDPPKVFAYTWNGDELRWEITPDGTGSMLVFTHTFGRGEPAIAKLAAGRTAAGWDVCLAALQAWLDGETFEPPQRWLEPMESYINEFGLAEGAVLEQPDGDLVRFGRDLVWKPTGEVWSILTEGGEVAVGARPPAPATNGYVPAGPVTAVEAPRVLEYEWLHDGAAAGRVRWEIIHDPLEGTRVELTQTLPAELVDLRATALAAWHTQLDLLFAATHGEVRCPWPTEQTESLEKHYAEAVAKLPCGTRGAP